MEYLRYLFIDERIILIYILKYYIKVHTGFNWLRIVSTGSYFEHCYKRRGLEKDGISSAAMRLRFSVRILA
jgi:hypothetical protein